MVSGDGMTSSGCDRTAGLAGQTPSEDDRIASWRAREAHLHRMLPYAGLLVGSLLATAAPAPGGLPLTPTLVVAVASAGWIAWFLTLHPQWQGRRRLMAVYYVGLLALAAVLVSASPWYGFFAWIGFLHAFHLLQGGWRFVGMCCSAVLVATAQSGGLPRSWSHWSLWLVLVLFNLVIAGAVSWLSYLGEREDTKRKRLVVELAAANSRLAETIQENEGLHAQLVTQAREAGVLDERQRMAREIHDTLAQGLTGIITQLEAAEQTRDRSPDWRRHVDNALALARESLTEARRSVRAVRPEPLETARLSDALTELGGRWSALHGVPASVSTTGSPRPLHPEVEVTLLRAAQEALANVARHAAASRVGVTLSYMPDVVTLDVRDDGAGFEATNGSAAPKSDGGYGLTAMRQRVTRVGGQLAVESEPGGGTAISASVPALPGGAG
ncbi:Signal transduction histidine kinase [Micromonospora phaseoli]|uniref:Oxygen sensor histidine kinase NreB n=1 Tax=Micromonospora phaseoli TaxID=1144548 RepID=A0A1H6XV79_9ACTN|nr:sensor histidine kinase [Micromonospora phaseoli]PZW02273.1 signal transduction histidine kinase [Micromonospora phaseoli]GIJ75723.1 histidine kinase [Micromonospora phaseoli]SEJ28802.1 Signal transduction histidine kinase [Micromonospora phaseoli]